MDKKESRLLLFNMLDGWLNVGVPKEPCSFRRWIKSLEKTGDFALVDDRTYKDPFVGRVKPVDDEIYQIECNNLQTLLRYSNILELYCLDSEP